jgi:hypothetical protein
MCNEFWWGNTQCPRVEGVSKSSPNLVNACCNRRLKHIPSIRGYSWTTVSPGGINTEAWSPILRLGVKLTPSPCKIILVKKTPRDAEAVKVGKKPSNQHEWMNEWMNVWNEWNNHLDQLARNVNWIRRRRLMKWLHELRANCSPLHDWCNLPTFVLTVLNLQVRLHKNCAVCLETGT